MYVTLKSGYRFNHYHKSFYLLKVFILSRTPDTVTDSYSAGLTLPEFFRKKLVKSGKQHHVHSSICVKPISFNQFNTSMGIYYYYSEFTNV